MASGFFVSSTAPASATSADGYCLVDWTQFPNSAQFQ